MFTGIVEETGEILAVVDESDGRRLRIGTSFEDLDPGDSINVSGACLTVEDEGTHAGGRWIEVFLSDETLDRTYLGTVTAGEVLNLERAMPADGRFDGHVVQGHVDGTAEIEALTQEGEDWTLAVSLPENLGRYVVEKGSITVDGISLTVADLSEDRFEVAIIPETYERTSLSAKEAGDPVHLEVDVLAKYVESLITDPEVE